MDKLKSLASNFSLPTMGTSSAGAKLSKAFKFDKQHNVLNRKERGDPFTDGPIFEEVSENQCLALSEGGVSLGTIYGHVWVWWYELDWG